MSYQPRSTNPYIMEKKLNDCVGGGGLDPSVLEEIQTEISILGSENTVMAQDIIDIKGSLNSINDNLNRFIDVTKELNTYNNSFSHTATEDCYVGIQFYSENNILNEEIKIDNKRISQRAMSTGSADIYFYDTFFVKKDHTITCVMAIGTSQATVYGCI